jgi:DNA invertase Pin-like site-specific DNA recombinase
VELYFKRFGNGVDTRIVGMDILIAVKGVMAKNVLHQIAHRTRRALTGLVPDGRSAGGKMHGYIAATKSPSGEREIDEAQAYDVRRIFSWYAAGSRTLLLLLGASKCGLW